MEKKYRLTLIYHLIQPRLQISCDQQRRGNVEKCRDQWKVSIKIMLTSGLGETFIQYNVKNFFKRTKQRPIATGAVPDKREKDPNQSLVDTEDHKLINIQSRCP